MKQGLWRKQKRSLQGLRGCLGRLFLCRRSQVDNMGEGCKYDFFCIIIIDKMREQRVGCQDAVSEYEFFTSSFFCIMILFVFIKGE